MVGTSFETTMNGGGHVLSSDGSNGSQTPPAKTNEEEERPFNVYVKNFSAAIDNVKMEEIFAPFGTIQSCAVLRDHTGRSKQVGFVQFSSAEEVESCIQEMHGKVGYGKGTLHVAATNRKPARAKRRPYYNEGTPNSGIHNHSKYDYSYMQHGPYTHYGWEGQIPVFYFPLYHPSQYSPSQYNSAYYPTHEPVHYQTSSPNYHYSYGGHMRYYYYGGGPYHSSLHYPPSSPMLTPSPTMSTIPLYTQSSTMTPSTGSPTDSPVNDRFSGFPPRYLFPGSVTRPTPASSSTKANSRLSRQS